MYTGFFEYSVYTGLSHVFGHCVIATATKGPTKHAFFHSFVVVVVVVEVGQRRVYQRCRIRRRRCNCRWCIKLLLLLLLVLLLVLMVVVLVLLLMSGSSCDGHSFGRYGGREEKVLVLVLM